MNALTPKRGFAFKDVNPSKPLPGDRLDTELDRFATAFKANFDYVSRTIGPDGRIVGKIIGKENIKNDVLEGWVQEVQQRLQAQFDTTEQASKTAVDQARLSFDARNEVKRILTEVETYLTQSGNHATGTHQAQIAAQDAAMRAERAQFTADVRQQDAETAAASARLSEDMAYRWAEKLDGPVVDPIGSGSVDDGYYSAKFWARYANTAISNGSYWFLGAHPEAPTEGNNGDPLEPGMWYYDTTTNQTYIWNGSIWQPISGSGGVSSVFTRIGDIVAMQADYAAFYKDINWLPDWTEVQNKPTEYPPENHTHTEGEIIDLDKYSQAYIDASQAIQDQAITDVSDRLDPVEQALPGKLRWRYPYNFGTSYVLNDMVRDGDWLMVANKDTSERAGPQLQGNPQWDLADAPAWTQQAFNGVVRSGREWDAQVPVVLKAFQVWVPTVTADTNYVIFTYTYPTGQPELIEYSQISEPLLLAGQWTEVARQSTTIVEGTTFGIIIDALNSGSDSTVTGGWARAANSNDAIADPLTGNWGTNNANTLLRISKTDADATDRSTELLGMVPGTEVTFADTLNPALSATYAISAAPVDQTTHVSWTVQLVDTGAQGAPTVGAVTTMTATVPVPASTDYVRLAGGNPTASTRGILALDGVDQGADADAFGVRIEFDEYVVSDDWDIAGYVGLGGSGTGGGGGGETPGGGASVTTGPAFPADPSAGSLHYMTAEDTGLYIWYDDGDSQQWVQTNGSIPNAAFETSVQINHNNGESAYTEFFNQETGFRSGRFARYDDSLEISYYNEVSGAYENYLSVRSDEIRAGSNIRVTALESGRGFDVRQASDGFNLYSIYSNPGAYWLWAAGVRASDDQRAYQIRRYDGVGNYVDTPFRIDFDTGVVSIPSLDVPTPPYYEEFHDPTNVASWRIHGNTLECWGTVFGGGATKTVPFPKTFDIPPIISGSGQAGTVAVVVTKTSVDVSSCVLSARRGDTNASVNTDFQWHAIGKWDGIS